MLKGHFFNNILILISVVSIERKRRGVTLYYTIFNIRHNFNFKNSSKLMNIKTVLFIHAYLVVDIYFMFIKYFLHHT